MKKYSISALILALVALVTLGGYQLFRPKKLSAVPVPVIKPASAPAAEPPPMISVEFNQAPLADVVAFVSGRLSYRFSCQGVSAEMFTWAEYGLPSHKLLASFLAALHAAGYTVHQDRIHFIITRPVQEAYQPIDFLSSGESLYFYYQGQIVPAADMPVPVRSAGGRFLALMPLAKQP